jgi:arginase family enzyme
MAALASRGTACGLVVTEFEPELDPGGTSALALARLVCRALDACLGS